PLLLIVCFFLPFNTFTAPSTYLYSFAFPHSRTLVSFSICIILLVIHLLLPCHHLYLDLCPFSHCNCLSFHHY
ncbi:hypothetical protein BJ165DRAFT_1520194, partial [Panaeolus papilionaceus]